MLIEVAHTTTYSYSAEIVESVMETRLEPRSDADQRVLRFELTVQPPGRVRAYEDGFRNTIHCFTVPNPHASLAVQAVSRVETRLTNPFQLPSRELAVPDAVEFWPFLQMGGPVLATAAIESLAERFRPSDDAGVLESLRALMRYIYGAFEYEPEVTSVSSTVEDVLSVGKGVCQDFAHLMIAVCRAMGVPARYVSGYVVSSAGGASRGDGASHAWCEAWVPALGWRGFDPTNDVLAAESHVKVGVGRSYRDVPPTRGVYRGIAEERIVVGVQTTVLESGSTA